MTEATRGSGFAGGLVGPMEVGGLSVFVNVGLPAYGEGDPPREFRHFGQNEGSNIVVSMQEDVWSSALFERGHPTSIPSSSCFATTSLQQKSSMKRLEVSIYEHLLQWWFKLACFLVPSMLATAESKSTTLHFKNKVQF